MGVINNEAVIATCWNEEYVSKVKEWVETLEDRKKGLFAFIPSLINGNETIFLAPCGSKKGWPEDKELESLRDEFIRLLDSFAYEDGSNSFSYVEVGYGEYGQKVLRGNNKNCYSDADYAL